MHQLKRIVRLWTQPWVMATQASCCTHGCSTVHTSWGHRCKKYCLMSCRVHWMSHLARWVGARWVECVAAATAANQPPHTQHRNQKRCTALHNSLSWIACMLSHHNPSSSPSSKRPSTSQQSLCMFFQRRNTTTSTVSGATVLPHQASL